MKQKLKLFSVIFWSTLTVVLGSVAVFLLALRFDLITTFNAYVVSSGSMEPAIKLGSVIFVKREPMYRVNDVIAFKRDHAGETIITHRVALAYRSANHWKKLTYVTRGDANKDFDPERVRDSNVVGRVILTVPYVGYGVNVAKTPKGFILLVIVPSTIIVYEELKAVSEELKKAIRRMKRKVRKHPMLLHPLHFSAAKPFQRAALVIPFAGVTLAIVGVSGSFFFDRETSPENMISVIAPTATPTLPAGGPSPTPTPTITATANHLVINEVYYDVDNTHNIAGTGGSNRGEWVEIYNPTGDGININGWTVADNTSSETLPDVTIPAGEFLIMTGATETELRSVWSIPAGTLFAQAAGGTVGNGFNNAGDRVRLRDSAAIDVDAMSWGGDTTFLNPAPPDVATGHSLERDPDGEDADVASDFVDRTTPQPGQ